MQQRRPLGYRRIFAILTVLGFGSVARTPALADTSAPLAPELQAFMTTLEPDFKDPKKPAIESGRAARGKRGAPITLVEYSDFQCPYCQRGFNTVEELTAKYKNKILFVFKNLPLPFHPLALPAAKRFLAITLQSGKKAYEFHDEVFKNQQAFVAAGESYLDDVAKKLKVNVEKMKKDMEGDKVSKMLEADKAEAASFEFTGTPGFVVNGVRIKGAYPTPVFEQIIERQLAAKTKPAKKSKAKKAAEPAADKVDTADKASKEGAKDGAEDKAKTEKPAEEKKSESDGKDKS